MRDVVKKEVLKLLHAGIIYHVLYSEWTSPVQVMPKKGGMTTVTNEQGEQITHRLPTGWRMCINYRKLNMATKKDHFPLPFIDEMLEQLANHSFFCFLNGYFGYHQIPIHLDYQRKTTFTCPYGTYAYRRMSFGLCNAPASFQRCMMSIFSVMIEKNKEVFMGDLSVYGKTFVECLRNLDKVLQWCHEKKRPRDKSARDATAREAKALQLGEGESAGGRQWIRRSRRVLVARVSAVAPAAPARSCLARSVVVPAAAGGANPAVSILISSTCTRSLGEKGWMAPSPQGWFASLKPRRPGSLSTRRNPRSLELPN
jgi:hypothetical protein